MKTLLMFLLISPLIYLAIALVLVALPFNKQSFNKQAGSEGESQGLNFENLSDVSTLVSSMSETAFSQETFAARDGAELVYRWFQGRIDTTVILIHGSGTEATYLLPFAESLQRLAGVNVLLPDLRGHGLSALDEPGDVDYLGQLDNDLFDLLAHVETRAGKTRIIMAGHSSGGGFALRSARYFQADAYLLLAPYLGHRSPTVRVNSGGWVQVANLRYIGLSMLNGPGIRLLNHLPVLHFNRPENLSDNQLDSYTYRLNESLSPGAHEAAIAKLQSPTLVLVGENDEAFYAEKFAGLFMTDAIDVQVRVLPGIQHLDLPGKQAAQEQAAVWLLAL